MNLKLVLPENLQFFLDTSTVATLCYEISSQQAFRNEAADHLLTAYPNLEDELENELSAFMKNIEPSQNDGREMFQPIKETLFLKNMPTNIQPAVPLYWELKLIQIESKEWLVVKPDFVRTLLDNAAHLQNELTQQKHALDEAAIVAITDTQGKITYVNKKFEKLSKFSSAELIGATHALVNSGHHEHSFFKDMWKTITSGSSWKGEIKNKAKDGSYYWVDTTIVPMLNEKNKPESYVAIRYDITDKVLAKAEIESERARTAYAEKMASLGELAAGIAHELGNPLASINAWLDVLINSISRGQIHTESFSKTAAGVKNKTERMSKILKGMLNYARDGSNDPFSKVNISALTKDVIDYTQYKLKKTGVMVSVDAPDYVELSCRETEISQVLVNMIINSCDAVAEQDERWIKVKILDFGQEIQLSVIDSGSGIPESIANEILKPFFTTKSTGKGTGLGLSISLKIVERHGGKLTLDREHPNTKFDIFLPKQHSS